MSHLGAVLFPQFREFEAARARTNNSLLAMHVANQIALDRLRAETDRDQLAPVIFRATKDIGRMNVSIDELLTSIEASERDFAFMAIPFLLGACHELLKSLQLVWLRTNGGTTTEQEALTHESLDSAYVNLASKIGEAAPADLILAFEIARKIRNRIVHYGGTRGSHLRSELATSHASVNTLWTEWSGADIDLGDGTGPMNLAVRDVIAVLALTTRLGRLSCARLGKVLDRNVWADMAMADFDQQSPNAYRDPNHGLRAAQGFCRTYYSALDLKRTDIEDARSRRREG